MGVPMVDSVAGVDKPGFRCSYHSHHAVRGQSESLHNTRWPREAEGRPLPEVVTLSICPGGAATTG